MSLQGGAAVKRLLEAAKRVVEVGVEDSTLAAFVGRRDLQTYLAFVAETSLARLDRFSCPENTFFAYRNAKQISQNNAEVLVLSGRFAKHFWSFGHYRHAQYLLWSPRLDWTAFAALPGLLKNLLLGRITVYACGFPDLGGQKRFFCALQVLKRSSPGARRYLSPRLGVPGFFRKLQDEKVNYVVLRWFEELPYLAPGEDLDLLVADEDVGVAERLLQDGVGLIPCDLYSVSGLPDTDYRGMAYYPPPLAEQLLERAVWHRDLYRVPSQEDHFFSLAYHALYHKGEQAGLPTTLSIPVGKHVEHDYAAHLTRLAEHTGQDLPTSMESLEAQVRAKGWGPPVDTIARLAHQNTWLRERLLETATGPGGPYPGLTVFFIRRKAVELGFQDRLIELIAAEGFHVLGVERLSAEARQRVQGLVRGGNWGRGPYPSSGGEPAVVVVGMDFLPIPPSREAKARFLTLDNERVLVKDKIRHWFNARVPAEERCNVLHSSDNQAEAHHYLQLALAPDQVEQLLARAEHLKASFATSGPVVRDLTKHGRRAKLEVIDHHGTLAVKKTFRPGFERFMAREHFAMLHFGKVCPGIPPLLASGVNFLVYPYYRDTLHLSRGTFRLLLPLHVMKQALEVLRFLYEQGYAHGDFTPSNVLWDEKLGLKVIDFEFLYPYEQKPETFTAAFDLAGLPDDFGGDTPKDVLPSYATLWEPLVGLTLEELLNAPTYRQHLLRFRYVLVRLPRQFARWRQYVLPPARWGVRWGWPKLARTPLGAWIRWFLS